MCDFRELSAVWILHDRTVRKDLDTVFKQHEENAAHELHAGSTLNDLKHQERESIRETGRKAHEIKAVSVASSGLTRQICGHWACNVCALDAVGFEVPGQRLFAHTSLQTFTGGTTSSCLPHPCSSTLD